MSTTDNTNAAINDPEFMNNLCGLLAIGGTLARHCRSESLNYKIVQAWIAENSERHARYQAVLKVREQHAKDEVIAELLSYIRADVTQAFNRETGALLPLHAMPEDVRKLIAGVEVEELYTGKEDKRVNYGRLTKIKLWDKPRSLETLAKHLAMLIERKEVDARLSLHDLLMDPVKDSHDQAQAAIAVAAGKG